MELMVITVMAIRNCYKSDHRKKTDQQGRIHRGWINGSIICRMCRKSTDNWSPNQFNSGLFLILPFSWTTLSWIINLMIQYVQWLDVLLKSWKRSME